jgi:hypothetical protein
MLTGIALNFSDAWNTPEDILTDDTERNGWFEVSYIESLVILKLCGQQYH